MTNAWLASFVIATVTAWSAAIQQDALAKLADDFSGRRGPVRCQPADTNWFTPAGRRTCVWIQGTVKWAPAELAGDGPSSGPFDLLTWAQDRPDSLRAHALMDSLNDALTKRGLQHYACRSGVHRWQMPGLAVEASPGSRGPAGEYRTFVYATVNSALLPKIFCTDVPDIPVSPAIPTRRGED